MAQLKGHEIVTLTKLKQMLKNPEFIVHYQDGSVELEDIGSELPTTLQELKSIPKGALVIIPSLGSSGMAEIKGIYSYKDQPGLVKKACDDNSSFTLEELLKTAAEDNPGEDPEECLVAYKLGKSFSVDLEDAKIISNDGHDFDIPEGYLFPYSLNMYEEEDVPYIVVVK